jgi:hypothetical protein
LGSSVVLLPQLVLSATPVHGTVHHVPLHVSVPASSPVQPVHPPASSSEQGSPVTPKVSLQLYPLSGEPTMLGEHVVPTYGVQSLFALQPGKQMKSVPVEAHEFGIFWLLSPQLLSDAEEHDFSHHEPLHVPTAHPVVPWHGSPMDPVPVPPSSADPSSVGSVHTNTVPFEILAHVDPSKLSQSAGVVQPGTQTFSFRLFGTQAFMLPRLLLPQAEFDVHGVEHHSPTQVPCLQSDAFVHGSPRRPPKALPPFFSSPPPSRGFPPSAWRMLASAPTE